MKLIKCDCPAESGAVTDEFCVKILKRVWQRRSIFSTGYYKFMKKDLSNCQKEIENRTKYLPFGHIVMAQEAAAAATWG